MDMNVMSDNLLKVQAFKLKGRVYTLTVLQVLDVNVPVFDEQLEALVSKAPRLFEQAPVVLDCTAVPEAKLDLTALCACIRRRGLLPVAVQGGSALFHERAHKLGLATLRSSSTHDKRVKLEEGEGTLPTKKAKANAVPVKSSMKTKLITSPVRSGQQVVSQGDLVVTASVSPGAELLAEGSIHVYGTLRGRALAGISGNQEARIFCQAFDPELVAIAGVYRLPETMEPCRKPSQILLRQERIEIELL
jgi:septum site-determining protein MinC